MKLLLFKFFAIITLSLTAIYADDGTSSNTLESENDKIVINNIPLSYNISIDESISRFVYDLLDARVKITNKSDTRRELEYKFIWYDEEGFEMSQYTSKWKRVRIDSKDTIILKNLAITPKIDSFKFYVRGKQ